MILPAALAGLVAFLIAVTPLVTAFSLVNDTVQFSQNVEKGIHYIEAKNAARKAKKIAVKAQSHPGTSLCPPGMQAFCPPAGERLE